MHKNGWTERDRFEDVKRPQFVRPKFDTLSPAQKQAILSSFEAETFLGARNLAMLCVFLDTGVRLAELVQLKESRVHLAAGYVEVYSPKTDEWRIIPLSDEAVAVCRNYLKWRTRLLSTPIRHRASRGEVNRRRKAPRQLTADTFFCSCKGEPLSENAVGLRVRRLRARLAQAGVVIPIHLHLFRHNFLTEKVIVQPPRWGSRDGGGMPRNAASPAATRSNRPSSERPAGQRLAARWRGNLFTGRLRASAMQPAHPAPGALPTAVVASRLTRDRSGTPDNARRSPRNRTAARRRGAGSAGGRSAPCARTRGGWVPSAPAAPARGERGAGFPGG